MATNEWMIKILNFTRDFFYLLEKKHDDEFYCQKFSKMKKKNINSIHEFMPVIFVV